MLYAHLSMPSCQVVFDLPAHPYIFDGYCAPQDPYKYSSPDARAIYSQGPLIPSSLYPLIEPEQRSYDPADVQQFWGTTCKATTAFWSEDFECLYNVIAEYMWQYLMQDWERLVRKFRWFLKSHAIESQRDAPDNLDLWDAISVRLEMREEHKTCLGKLNPDLDAM